MSRLIIPLAVILLGFLVLWIFTLRLKRKIAKTARVDASILARAAAIRVSVKNDGQIDPAALETLKRMPGVFEKKISITLGDAAGSAVASAIQDIVDQARAGGVAAALDLPPEDELGVAEVLSVSRSGISLELDAIGAPKRRVYAQPPADQELERGERVYVRLDPNDPSAVAILPPSATGGQTPPPAPNRLDVLVLGPRLLKAGEKAAGVVRRAESIPLANPALAERGFSKWRLELDVRPERGWPYNADLTVALTTPEKAARIAHAGAEVALRYDPDDPQTLSLDSIAMGYGDPYAEARGEGAWIMSGEITANVSRAGVGESGRVPLGGAGGSNRLTLMDAGSDKIQVIKVVRDLFPDLGLADAKRFVENTPRTFDARFSDADAEKVQRALESAGAFVRIEI